MPVYRLTAPGQQPELLEADYVRDEGRMVSLRGTALVMGRPREIVVRRVPRTVLVEELQPAALDQVVLEPLVLGLDVHAEHRPEVRRGGLEAG
jgi:hypothetical protein